MGESAYKLQYLLNRSQSNEERYPLKVRDLISYNFDYKQAPISFVKANGKDQARKDLDSVGFIGDMWFEPLEADELQLPFEDVVMAIDPSGSGADETAYVIGGFLAGRLYLLSSGGLQGGYHDDSLRALCDQAFEYRVNKVVLEKNLGGGVYTQLFKNALFEYYKKKPHH
jgi:hypothetical protein